MIIEVAFLPRELADRNLGGMLCIVLDIFRATTSMITAFANGCRTIIPATTVEEARAVAAGQKNRPYLLAGERKGLRIDGFQFGNSPREFMRKFADDAALVMTTTNGTRAVKAAAGADGVLIGGFINAAAVCRHAADNGKDILIVCAGTDGLFSLEDALCAGLLVNILGERENCRLTDAARAAMLMYQTAAGELYQVAATASHGRCLSALGFAEDVAICLDISTVSLVPEYRAGEIRVFK